MLGDTAIAVNSNDNRYKNIVGKFVTIPLAKRKIKIIKDDYADPEQGTGAVKITPGHDFNDYEVGKRNKLQIINIFTEEGKINEEGPREFIGLDRFEARKKIIAQLAQEKLLVKEKNIKNKVPYGDRSNSILEPFLQSNGLLMQKNYQLRQKKLLNLKQLIFFLAIGQKLTFNG